MGNDNLPQFIQDLLNPDAYSHPADTPQLVQTHISYVILAGDFVYKFKKEVDFGFLDFSSLAKRKACCEKELLLNRRLCPDIYLGIVEVRHDGSQLSLDGDGEVVEYGVQMRRMPEDKMMVNLLNKGEVSEKNIDDIVEVLIPFYDKAERSKEIDTFGTTEAVKVNVFENFDQTETFVDGEALSRKQFEAISQYATSFLQDSSLFAERIKEGRIRDCHGDLYSANICLAGQVYIYDCIEFNERFRYCDVASDVAFLAMDLDFHGQAGLSEYFLTRLEKESQDEGLAGMLNFYKCYRAYVRGKIGLFTAADPAVDPGVKKSSLEAAGKYFFLAETYANR